jgi:hypothetical protein
MLEKVEEHKKTVEAYEARQQKIKRQKMEEEFKRMWPLLPPD